MQVNQSEGRRAAQGAARETGAEFAARAAAARWRLERLLGPC